MRFILARCLSMKKILLRHILCQDYENSLGEFLFKSSVFEESYKAHKLGSNGKAKIDRK